MCVYIVYIYIYHIICVDIYIYVCYHKKKDRKV